jgi:hypothetical protein
MAVQQQLVAAVMAAAAAADFAVVAVVVEKDQPLLALEVVGHAERSSEEPAIADPWVSLHLALSVV